MIDFTDREKKIIQLMLTIINPFEEVRKQDEATKIQLIKEALRIRNLEFNEPELVGLINGITEESQITVKLLYGFLQKKGIDWRKLDFKTLFKPNL